MDLKVYEVISVSTFQGWNLGNNIHGSSNINFGVFTLYDTPGRVFDPHKKGTSDCYDYCNKSRGLEGLKHIKYRCI